MIANLNLTTDQQRPQQPTYYSIRMDSALPYALILKPEDREPQKREGFFSARELSEKLHDEFPSIVQLPFSKFRLEMEKRLTHTLEMQCLLAQNSTEGQDLTNFSVYGSVSRPVGSWAQIESATYIQVSQQTTGYYTYIAVPAKLDEDTLERYELAFISHP